MTKSEKKLRDQLFIALCLAREEIHHPGSNRRAGIDIDMMLEGLIKQASKEEHIGPQAAVLVRDEMASRAA